MQSSIADDSKRSATLALDHDPGVVIDAIKRVIVQARLCVGTGYKEVLTWRRSFSQFPATNALLHAGRLLLIGAVAHRRRPV